MPDFQDMSDEQAGTAMLSAIVVPGLLARGYEVDVVHRAAIKIARNILNEITSPDGEDIP